MKVLSHTSLFHFLLNILLITFPNPTVSDGPCRDQCGSVEVHYPFGIDDGCGAPQFRGMLTCNTTSQSLFFITPNGNYKVQSIDYKAQTMTVYDPDMSTCTILQPHHDVALSDLQYAIIPSSPDTVFALLNCSIDSPILHRYQSLCFDLPGHKCQDLYSSCNSFKVFTLGGGPNNFPISQGGVGGGGGFNTTSPSPGFGTPGVSYNYEESPPGYFGAPSANASGGSTGSGIGVPGVVNNFPGNNGGGSGTLPPCCFTGYSTVKVMRMDILDCTHFTSFYDTDKLKGVEPMDWSYGLKFSYSVPDMGCERCSKSGGSCGYDTEMETLLCLCSTANNSTRQCGEGSDSYAGDHLTPSNMLHALFTIGLGVFFLTYPWI